MTANQAADWPLDSATSHCSAVASSYYSWVGRLRTIVKNSPLLSIPHGQKPLLPEFWRTCNWCMRVLLYRALRNIPRMFMPVPITKTPAKNSPKISNMAGIELFVENFKSLAVLRKGCFTIGKMCSAALSVKSQISWLPNFIAPEQETSSLHPEIVWLYPAMSGSCLHTSCTSVTCPKETLDFC